MKKAIKLLVFVSLVLAVLLFSVSCENILNLIPSSKDTNTTNEQNTPVSTTPEPNTTTPPECAHIWVNATCTTPKTCSACSATEGEALGHSWANATCTTSKTCSACSATEGEALGHSWGDWQQTQAPTCTNAGSQKRACPVCSVTETKTLVALGHSWTNATCTTPKTCSVCSVTEGSARGHSWKNATCLAPKTCSVCNATEGNVGEHAISNVGACSTCGESFITPVEEAIKIGMSFAKSNYAPEGSSGQYFLTDEYHYVMLTLDDQVNSTTNGFARAKIAEGLYVTVDGSYDFVLNSIQLGDTVVFKAKLGAANSAKTTGGKELRLYQVVAYTVVDDMHTHVYGTNVTVIVPATCATDGTGTVACACGSTKKVTIPATNSHTPNDDFACSACGKSLLISVEDAIKIGMSYEKGQYSTEYYYIQLTLDDQVNANGFARSYIYDGFYFTVAGPYACNYVEGTIKLGDTVIYKAKLGAVNSAMTIGGKEPRLYEVAAYKIVASTAINVSVTLDEKPDIVTYHSSFASFTEVDEAPSGVTFDLGYRYVKKSRVATIEKSALVWNTYGKYGNISFDIYVDKITDKDGAACTEIELQLSEGARFVSVVDANGNKVAIVYKNSPYVVLKKGQSYHIVVNVNDTLSPAFYFGWSSKTCELYFYNFSIQKSQYEYIVDNAEQTVVCKKDGETYGYFAWPTVTKLDGDRLIAVASGFRSAHVGPDGKVAAWFSEDGGKTWSEPTMVADTLLDDRDAGVVYWNGKIIVSWFCASKVFYSSNNTSIDDAYDNKYMGGNYIISEDGGKTWSEIYSMPDGMFTSHGLIVNPDGGLTSVGYLKYDKVTKRWGTGIAVRTTTGEMDENGFVWSEAIVIADSDTQYAQDFHEPYGIYNDDGVLIVVMRSDKGLYQCELQPGQTKFSNWHLIARVQETPAHMIQHSSGVMIMTYGYRGIYVDANGKAVSYTERNKDTTLGIRARLSYDGGLTWTQEIILSYGLKPTGENTSDWGYSSSVELSDGRILTLFYQRTAGETLASIYQIIWEIPSAPTGDVTLTFVGGKADYDGADEGDGLLITTLTGKAGEKIVLPQNPTKAGYTFEGWYLDYEGNIPFTPTTYSKDLLIYAKWTAKPRQTTSIMSFNVKVNELNDYLSDARAKLVVDTILENNPYVFGVQEADDLWMSRLNDHLGSIYTSVGKGRDGSTGEHSAIFYRTDMFNLIDSGTKWLSSTPDKAGSKYSYTEGGTTYTANYPRIMTYVVLERKSDGVKFIYVNTHLDNNGSNNGTVAEKIRQGEVEILLAEIQKLCTKHGNLPTIVSGDFNTQPGTASYTTMTANGYLDSSKITKQGEIKPTYNNNEDSFAGIIFDYIFVSPNLANAVKTYTVCPPKRDGEWISDHNAIIATIALPVA